MNTAPTWRHTTVLLNEAVQALVTQPDGTYVDGTFGRGGHSRALLARLSPAGRLVAFDKDPEAINEAAAITDPRFVICHASFDAMQPELASSGEQATPLKFGAKDVQDLSWKNLMDAYSCTECGRCSAACPANQTGKLLSPRKIMMATRDRLEEVGKNINNNGDFKDDGKSLVHDYITTEELRACTTCNACVQECPVSISPLDIIVQLRRYLVMEESNSPQEWTGMFSNVENNFAPWKFSPDERDKWAEELKSH